MLCALIMAGGKGERFWPLSTEDKPKQFLNLLGTKSMIQITVERMEKLIPIDRVFVVTGEKYLHLLREQIPKLPLKNIIVEPMGRNTAPCIALSAFAIQKCFDNATIVVVPSDHLIVNEEKFINSIHIAEKFVEEHTEAIITIGIKPNRPETGYGYIRLIDESGQGDGVDSNIYKVNEFVEKPNAQKAKEYLQDGSYLWNSGMFIWKAEQILKLTKKYLKNTYKILSEVSVTSEDEFNRELAKRYAEVDNISIDYGIMEKAKDVYVIPVDFGWDDVGTWSAVERYSEKDSNNNITVGSIKNIESCNNIIMGTNKPIIVVGLSDIFVVETDKLIFIGKKENIENIKEIKNKLKE